MPRTPTPLAALCMMACTTFAPAAPVTVEIFLPEDTDADQILVGVRGDTAPLAWDRSLYLADPDGDGTYSATIEFPEDTGVVSYKAVVERMNADAIWEEGPNRLLFPSKMNVDTRRFNGTQTDLPVLTVTRDELREDLDVMVRGLEALHPSLTLHKHA